MKPTIYVQNSFCFLHNFPEDVYNAVHQALTYRNDIEGEKGHILSKLAYFKKYRNHSDGDIAKECRQKFGWWMKQLKELEATEWVHWLKNGEFPTGHLNIVKDVIELSLKKSEFDIVDQRKEPTNKHLLGFVGEVYPPRYYQKDMIDLGLKTGRGVFESAVGTGKSLVMQYLISELNVTSLIIVPSKPLKDQHLLDLHKAFGDRKVKEVNTNMIRGKKKLPPIRLTTIQTMAALKKTGELDHLIKDVDAIFVDEIHHAGSKSYTDLLEDMSHIYYRFGFTGTFLRNDSKTLDMWGFLSNRLYSYPAYKAIEEGYLTPLTIKIHNLPGNFSRKYQKEYDLNYCGNPLLLEKIEEIVNSSPGQVLIMVNRKDKSGKIINEYLNECRLENTYISGDDDKETQTNAIKDFNDKKIRVLVGSQVIGEGIDIRSTDHIIMAQGGKSEIAIVQATGRAVRLYEGKKMAYLHDFHFEDTKYMAKHLSMRKDIYQNNFDVTEFES